MKKLILIILVIFSKLAIAQTIDPNTVNQLYSKTFEYYFRSTSIKSGSNNKPEYLIIKDSIPDRLSLTYSDFTLKIVNSQNDAIKEIEKSNKTSGSVSIINRKFNKDTLDISIGTWGIKIKKGLKIKNWHFITKQIFLSANCGGTNGYIPTGRLVYNRDLTTWSFMTSKDIFDEMKKKSPDL